jgi:hypothetical protein
VSVAYLFLVRPDYATRETSFLRHHWDCRIRAVRFYLYRRPHLALEVDDFDQTIDLIRRHKVPFALEPVETPRCRAAIVLDPDGNKLRVHKRKA